MEKIVWNKNRYREQNPRLGYSLEGVSSVRQFHKTLPGYQRTPFHYLPALAEKLKIGELMVKDESKRFGLNSFKGLGGSYAIAKCLSEKYRIPLRTYFEICEEAKKHPQETFTASTAGNHGRGVAWAARIFGQKAVIYMPKGSNPYKVQKIRELGAETVPTDLLYDDAVQLAASNAKKNGWTVIQDTSWENYTKIPKLIMEGYATIAMECSEQWQNAPTHVILQAGVGSFAAGVAEALQLLSPHPITFILVEPAKADCFYQSSLAMDGLPRDSKGDLASMMAGLSCLKPSIVAWDMLKPLIHTLFACPEETAAKGMRMLAHPSGNDPVIVSGESAAVSLGLLLELCTNSELVKVKEQLGLNSKSRVLFVSTEGDTDPDNYRLICG